MNRIKSFHKYPYIAELINSGGGLSMEYVQEMKVVAVAFDESGAIWKGKRDYESIEALLEDAEAGIRAWADQRW